MPKKNMKPLTIKCDVCGRFIPYSDFDNNRASRFMITPDSDISSEEFQTLCNLHQNKEKLK